MYLEFCLYLKLLAIPNFNYFTLIYTFQSFNVNILNFRFLYHYFFCFPAGSKYRYFTVVVCRQSNASWIKLRTVSSLAVDNNIMIGPLLIPSSSQYSFKLSHWFSGRTAEVRRITIKPIYI